MKSSVGAAIGVALVASLAVAATFEARASVYDFQFTSPEATASGQFVVDPTTDQVTSISGSVSVNGQPIDPITTILADPSFPSPYNNGPFIYDNTYYGGNPVFDADGVLFATAGNPGGSWNLWGNGADSYSLYEYVPNVGYVVAVTGTFAVSTPQVSSSAVSTPESSTWAMLLLGFAGLGFAGYRKARRDVTDLAIG
jgi:hypothetical protein